MSRVKTSAALCAAQVRKELKEKYPEIAFYVRPHTFANGDEVSVYYDGEKHNGEEFLKELRSTLSKYKYGHFDYMTDMYEYSNCRDDVAQVKYLFLERRLPCYIAKKVQA